MELIDWLNRMNKEYKKPKGLPDPSNVSLATGIYMSAVRCLVSGIILSYLVFSWLALHSPILCLYPFEPLFLTSIRDCCRLWELGSKSAFAFILLGFWDRTVLALLVSCHFLVVWCFERILCC